ncbi:MAG: glutamate 5-kinase [Ruminococcaceae bacterium]|nr:glutamate 5-kinase [Oscillospiraceae bacterium]
MRIVIKVGTSTLAHAGGRLNIRRVELLCKVLSDLQNAGHEIVLVSSGAIGMGVGKLGLPGRPQNMSGKQAAAAVGQCALMYTYDKLFTEHGHTVAQLLLTAEDIQDPRRSGKVHDTLEQLITWKVIPVINENDAVSTDEIGIHTTIGENDTLSAIVARLLKADLLVLLSDIQGLYTADPHKDPNATLIPVVEELTEDILSLAGGAGSALGSGGMATKLRAAKIVMDAGLDMIIMNGENPEALYDLFEQKAVGTRFIGKKAHV